MISKKIFVLILVFILLLLNIIPTTNAGYLKEQKASKNIIKKSDFFPIRTIFQKLFYGLFKTGIDDFQEIKPIWTNYWGGDFHEGDCQIAVDPDNNCIYLLGNSMSFSDYMCPFLVKYNLDGKKQWETILFYQVGGAYSVAVEKGYVYVTGLIFSSSKNTDVFITKYDSEGNKIWFKKWDGSSFDVGYSVLCVGNTLYVGGITVSDSGYNSNDALLLCFEDKGSTCDLLWYKTWDGGKDDSAQGIALYKHYLYICGTTRDVNGKISRDDGLLLRYDTSNPDGKLVVFDIWSTKEYDKFHDVVVHDDSLFVVGWTQGFSHEYDIVLLKYNLKTKQREWQRVWGELDDNIGYGVAVGDSHVFVVGEIRDFSGVTEKSACIVLKFDFDGDLVWSKIWGKKVYAHGEDIQFYSDNLYVGGRHARPDFKSYNDVFVFKCNKNGGRVRSRFSGLDYLFRRVRYH